MTLINVGSQNVTGGQALAALLELCRSRLDCGAQFEANWAGDKLISSAALQDPLPDNASVVRARQVAVSQSALPAVRAQGSARARLALQRFVWQALIGGDEVVLGVTDARPQTALTKGAVGRGLVLALHAIAQL